MFWINGLEMKSLGHSLYLDYLLRKKVRIHCFAEFITMSSTLLRIAGPSVGFFTRNLGREPWSLLKRNRSAKGVVAVMIHGNSAKAEGSKESFHPNIVRTLQKSPKFRTLFNQLGFGRDLGQR